MDCGWEFALCACRLHHSHVLLRLQVKEATWTSCVHHHLIQLKLRISIGKQDSLVLEVFWVALAFFWTLDLSCRNRLSSYHERTFFALSCHDTNLIHLFMLQDVHEDYSGHVRIIGRLMVVRKQGLSRVVAAVILCIILTAQVALELVILCALLINLAKCGIVEGF